MRIPFGSGQSVWRGTVPRSQENVRLGGVTGPIEELLNESEWRHLARSGHVANPQFAEFTVKR
jgi:hypothetical protein